MRIKMSNRGLTFSFAENDTFKAGTRYRYIVDTKSSEVVIIPDENGKYKMSRKGAHAKPLVDLRNEEIKKAMALASHMEVEVMDDKIIVHIIKKQINTEGLSDRQLADMIDKSEDITFAIDKKSLIEHDGALIDMLTASGIFSTKTRKDISYVFDTVSLFSGAGLLDLPFARDDSFDIKLAVDFDKAACETYKNNIGDHIMCMDMRDLKDEDIPDADFVMGGVCCQAYSNASRGGDETKAVAKRLLIQDYLKAVKTANPLIFLIENVPQFITKDQGKFYQMVLTELSDNYNITYSIVNDSELGGYSTRKRMILIGSKKCMDKIIIPNVELNRSPKTVGDALKKVDSTWFNYSDITKPSASTIEKMKQVPQGGNYKFIKEMKSLDRHSNVYRRLDENAPSVTLTNWRKVNLTHPTENRILSVSEGAAIMGLDKTFKFYGSINDKQQQCGNGVPQSVARFCKSIIKNALYGYANSMVFNHAAVEGAA